MAGASGTSSGVAGRGGAEARAGAASFAVRCCVLSLALLPLRNLSSMTRLLRPVLSLESGDRPNVRVRRMLIAGRHAHNSPMLTSAVLE